MKDSRASAITQELVESCMRITFDAIPSSVVSAAKTAITDAVGVTLAGSAESSTQKLLRYAKPFGSHQQASLVGLGQRADVTTAALINGFASHVLDLDDTSASMRGHPTAPLISALIPLAEWARQGGELLIESFIVGFEAETKIGRLVGTEHYDTGWHSTGLLGCVGAAVACSRILGLDADKTSYALGIAASLGGGLVANFGTDTKALHIGFAARNGVEAALLAEQGLSSSKGILEQPCGFLDTLGAKPTSNEWAVPGDPWDIVDPGIALKLYPSCTLTHAAIEAALELRSKHNLSYELIESVTCLVDYRIPHKLPFSWPKTIHEARFSIEFCIAVALVRGSAGLEDFTIATLADERIQEIMGKVAVGVHPLLTTHESIAKTFSVVEITTKDGSEFRQAAVDPLAIGDQVLHRGAIYTRGSPARPLTDTELSEKMRLCASRTHLGPHGVDDALIMLRKLESLSDVALLTERLRG